MDHNSDGWGGAGGYPSGYGSLGNFSVGDGQEPGPSSFYMDYMQDPASGNTEEKATPGANTSATSHDNREQRRLSSTPPVASTSAPTTPPATTAVGERLGRSRGILQPQQRAFSREKTDSRRSSVTQFVEEVDGDEGANSHRVMQPRGFSEEDAESVGNERANRILARKKRFETVDEEGGANGLPSRDGNNLHRPPLRSKHGSVAGGGLARLRRMQEGKPEYDC